jgi:DNA-binding NtrC family response regulator
MMKMPEHTVLFLDCNEESRKSLSFVLGIANFALRSFRDEAELLNWLEVVGNPNGEVLCILVNGEMGTEGIVRLLDFLNERHYRLPVLVVDRQRLINTQTDLHRGRSFNFPVYACDPVQVMDFLGKFKVLRRGLRAADRPLARLAI